MSGKTDKRRQSAAEMFGGGEMVKPASMREIVAMESEMGLDRPAVTSLPTSSEEMAELMGRASGAEGANKTNVTDAVTPGVEVDPRKEPMKGLYDALRADGCNLPEYGDFRTWMGEDANRRKLYDALRADGCSLPDDYDEFAKKISYQPNMVAMRQAVARGEEALQDMVALGKHKIGQRVENPAGLNRGMAAGDGATGGIGGMAAPGSNAAPVSGGYGINPTTGLPEPKYLTEAGAVYDKGEAALVAQSDWAAQERQAEQQSIYDEVDSVMVGWDQANPKASKEERNAQMQQVYGRIVWQRRMDDIDREIAGAERQRNAIAAELEAVRREGAGAKYQEIFMREGREAADAYMQSIMDKGRDGVIADNDARVRRSGDLSRDLNLANIRLRTLRDAKERHERGEEHERDEADRRDGSIIDKWNGAVGDYGKGILHGVKNVVTDPMGMVSAFDAGWTQSVLNKLERREDLTENEEAMLDATVFRRSTDAYSASKGIAYQIGEFVPELAEMAAEFGFSPLSGATRAVCAQGIKTLGIHGFKQLLRNPRFMAKVAGTATLEGASIAATTQAAKNYSEMVGRMVGDPVRDLEGKVRWISGGDSFEEAFAKTAVRAVGSNAMFVLPTNIGGNVLRALEGQGAAGKIIAKLARTTEYLPWHNPVDALAKMKSSELISVALGDESWGDYTDEEANAVLLGSVLAAEMTSNGPRAATAAAKYASARFFERRMKGAYFRARNLFEQRGGEKAGEAWDRLADRLTTLDTEGVLKLATALKMMSEGKRAAKGEVDALMRGTTVTSDEAAAFFDFARAMVAFQSQYGRRRAGGYAWTFEDTTSYDTGGGDRGGVTDVREIATRSFDEGFDAAPSELDVTRRAAAEARQRIVDKYDEDYAAMMDADPIGFMESGQAGVEEMEYINLKARQSGIEARISTTEAEAAEAANAEERRRTNRQSGMVMRVRIGFDEESARDAYVVSGNVALLADGLPDRSASDNMLVVMDAESGALEYCSPDKLMSVEEVRAPREVREAEEPEGSELSELSEESDASVAVAPEQEAAPAFKGGDMANVGVMGSDELQSGMVVEVMPDGRVKVWTSQPVDESSVELEERDGMVGYVTEMESRQQGDVAEAAAEVDGMIGRSLSEEESAGLISRMESKAEVAPEVELTPENWITQFGEDGAVETPLGTVKMGDNQYFKLAQQGRGGKLGMIKPTLQHPDIIIEDHRPAANSERDTSFIFVKTFKKSDGSRFYYFTSVTVSKGGREVVISNQEKSGKRISKLLQQGKVAWINDGSLHPNTQVGKSVSFNDSNTPTNSDNEGALLGIDSSAVGKGTENGGDMQAGALSRVPVDKKGKPDYEAVDSETAWDALVERSGGDEAIAGEIAAEEVAAARGRLAAAEDRLKKLREGADKTDKSNKANKAAGVDSMDIDERIAAKKAAKEAAEREERNLQEAVESEKLHVAKWEEIADVKRVREIAARAEVEKAERAEAEARSLEAARRMAEEEARQQREREELEGVPDFSIDKPEDARRRGFVRVAGTKIERQQPFPADHSGYGMAVEPMFASGANPVRAKGRVLIAEVDDFQPSHVDGRINPAHMIPEGQPKARHKDGGVSLNTADQNAKNIDPKLVTRTEDPYTGAPVVNRHREGVQGNGRLQMLRLLYEKYPEKGAIYKQYLIDHAEEFGVDPEYIRSLERPAMAIEIEGDDARAIELGQMTSQDNESGGIERIKPKHTARKMGENMSKFAGLLMNDGGDGDASFSELVTQNGPQTLEWMNRNGYISDTQMSSALRADGRLTEDAVKDLKDILYQSVFDGAPTRMEEMFAALPAKAQKAILATAYRDHSSPEAERLVPEIQNAIVASYMLRSYGLFAEAKNPEACRRAIESWKAQSTIDDLGNVVFPAEIFSNFALELAARFKGDTQKQIQTMLGRILDAVQGRTEDLFAEGPAKPMTVADAIREVTGIDYKPTKPNRYDKDVDDRDALLDRGDQNGEGGRPAGSGTLASGEHDQAGAEPAERGRGADGVRPESGVGERNRTDTPEPTEAQKEAGNYQKEHRRIDGYRISIENAKGSVRRGTDASGESWEVTMHNDYGYIRGTKGVDGDHIDVFLSDTPEQGDVFVVDQVKPDGTFDEHKVMYGFATEEEARQAYLSNYSPGWKGLGAITHVSKEEFKKWVESSKRKTKPFADYKSIKKSEGSEKSELSEEAKAGGEKSDKTDKLEAGVMGAYQEIVGMAKEFGAGEVKTPELERRLEEWFAGQSAESLKGFDAGQLSAICNAAGLDKGQSWALRMAIDKAMPKDLLGDVWKLRNQQSNANNADIHVDTIGNRDSSSPFKYFQGTIAELIKLAGEGASGLIKKIISPIGERLRKDLTAKGLDIDGTYNHVIDNNAIRHALKHHGSKNEEKRGQIPITESDFSKLDDVVNNYDNIEVEIGKRGIANIKYSRTYDDGTTIFVEEQRVGRKELAAVTMWKTKNPTRTDANLTKKTPISDLNEVSEGKGSGLFDDLQDEGEKRPAEKIKDFGEKIAGARKDMLRDLAKSVENVTVQSLIELPLGKAFKKPNLKKMVENGAISDSDALLAEAVMQALVFGQKKPVVTRRMSSKREISEWAQRTYEGIRFLGEILSGDEARREKALSDRRAMMEDRLTKANAHIDNLRQWNPGKQFEYHESLPDEVEVIRTVLERIGYRAGDAVNLPLCRISVSSNGKSYEVQSAGKQGAFWFKRYHDTLESAIKTMEVAARLKRGDMEVELPARQFVVRGQGKMRMEPSGQYEVVYFTKKANNFASKTFDNEADANAFAQSNDGKVRELQRYTNEYAGYQAAVVNPLTGNSHLIGEMMPTRAEASAWLDSNHEEANRQGLDAVYAEMGTKRSSREHFYIGTSYDRKAGKVVYSVIEDDKSNPWPIKKEFGSRNEAEAWLKENMARLEEERKIRKEKERQVVYFNPSRDRRGPDHRQGKAATSEMFADTFGFRGVQFGNWTSGADRQAALDQAYDALMDMAGALGLTPRAMSLDGELGLAFGARGGGGASAHYEPGAVVINLTKTKGAGALAHEWWHAVDNYLARHGGVPLGHVTHGNGLEQLRPEVRDALDAYMQAVDGSEYARRSRDKGDYWGRGTEVAARLFASWIDYKLNGVSQHSPFLASGLNTNIESLYRRMNYLAYRGQERARAENRGVAPQVMSEEEFNKTPQALTGYPYPTQAELEGFDGVMTGIFDALSARESASGSMANERRRRYHPTAVGRGLFDGLEETAKSEPSEDSSAAEQANRAIDSYAAGYNEYLERTQELEKRIGELEAEGAGNREELQEQIEQEEALLLDHRAHLEDELREFYLRNNTPEDAADIARSMVARTQAEVEVRRNGRQILKDIIWGSERSELSERSEAEPTEVVGREVKTAGGVIGYNAVGHLPDAAKGEFGLVERQMSLIGEFGFTGNSRVKDRGDVAYIFRAMEDYSIEHVFVAFQKGESLKVMHIGMGGPSQSYADMGAIRAGYDAFGADKIYLVHNHPTGNLLASVPDQKLMRTLEAAFPDIDTEGIIMDTTSGRYGTFHGTGATESHERPQAGGNSEVGVMRIDRAKRDKDRLPEMPVIRSSADVAAFVGGQRLGGGDKVSYLVLANNNRIVANFHTGYGSLKDPALAEELASTATKWGGTSVIVYGNVDVKGASALKSAVSTKSLGGVRLLDAMEITNGMKRSAMDEGYLNEEMRPAYNSTSVSEPAMATGAADFEATRDRAIAQKGIVMPGLNKATVRVVEVPRHSFVGDRPIAQAKAWAKANIVGEHHLTDSNDQIVKYSISARAIDKYLSQSAIGNSENLGVHLSTLTVLPEVIGESIEAEIHPDYHKGEDGKRAPENGYGEDKLIHRFYGAVTIDGETYRVKTTIAETRENKFPLVPHSFEVTEIELLTDANSSKSLEPTGSPKKSGVSHGTAKLLNGVEKSYDKGVKLLEESRKEDERAFREYGYDENAGRGEVREPEQAYQSDQTADRAAERRAMIGEQGDPLKDRVMKAALHLAGKDGENMAARDAAMKAIGKRVGNIRKAMRVQKTYDAATVGEIRSVAGAMLESGLLDEMSGGEVKRLLGAMTASVAGNDMRVAADRLLDLVIDNQVRLSKDMLDKALRVKGSKTNAAGVRVGAKLDPMGQQMVKAAREGIEALTEDGVAERIQYLYNEIGEATKAKNDDLKAEYQAMLTGMEIARGYHADVRAKDRAIADLNLELTKLLHTWSDLETKEDRDCYRQEKRALEDAIRTLKSEKADGLREVAGAIMGGVGESMERMKAWREAEQARIDHIHHMANADMEGTSTDEFESPKLKGLARGIEKTLNSPVGKFFFGPMATFEQMMRLFGRHSFNGEGYCYDYFIRGKQRCEDKKWLMIREIESRLNAKAKEVGGAKKFWSELFKNSTKDAGVLKWRSGGEMREYKVTQGKLLYVYAENKMEDCAASLRHMGITEEAMAGVEAKLNPRLKEIIDWVQDVIFQELGNEANKVHLRMYGAPMKRIENYFPKRINPNSRTEKEPLKKGTADSPALPTTMTGAIVERKPNILPLDILNSDAISVVLEHIYELVDWICYAEYRRDMSTLLSYNRFVNQVKNTKSIYGSGEKLWTQFKNLALINAGAYKYDRSDFDDAGLSLMGGTVSGCIAFNYNTAIKQLLSLPAFLSETNAYRLIQNSCRPLGSCRWAIRNLPNYQKRWLTRQAGNEILKTGDDEWDIQDSRWRKKLQRAGLAANAAVDALTIAAGARSVYESKYNRYVKAGWNKETAHQKAIEDAEIAFNLSQQSSESSFMSIMQSKRTIGSSLFSMFKNSVFSYFRQEIQACREINNFIHDKSQTEFEIKKWMREGLSEENARAYAKKERNRVIAKNLFKLAIFNFMLSTIWNGYDWYLICGEDEEQKEEILEDAVTRGLYGGLDGITMGGILPDMIFEYVHKGESTNMRGTELSPFAQEVGGALDALTGNNPWKGVHRAINLLATMTTGINPQIVEDWVVAGMDFFAADDLASWEEWRMLGMRLLHVPQSQTDKIYLDRLGLWSDEARKEPPAKLARRFAHYKATRSNIPGALAMSAERWAEEEEPQRKRFDKMAKELLEKADKSGHREKFEAYADEYMRIDAQYKELTAQSKRGDVDYDDVLDKLLALKDSPEYQRYERYKKVKGMYEKSVDRWLNAGTPEATIEALRDHETVKRLLVEIIERKNLDSVMEAAAELEDMRQGWQRRDLGWEQGG